MNRILRKRNAFCLFLLSFSFLNAFASCVSGTETCIYHSQEDKSGEAASGYKKTETSLSRYLSYTDSYRTEEDYRRYFQRFRL